MKRLAALGNSFIEKWHGEMRLPAPSSRLLADDEPEGRIGDEETEAEEQALLPLRRLNNPRWIRPSEAFICPEREKHLRSKLVLHFLRLMEFRGSDVRLDLGLFYRPEAAPRTSIDPSRWSWSVAHSYPYTREEHINVLELRSILHALEWRSRVTSFHSCRFLHLSDSQVCLSVLTKGRSSSRLINRLLRRIAALCLALDLLPLWAWVESRLNPADEPSRRYEPSHQTTSNQAA